MLMASTPVKRAALTEMKSDLNKIAHRAPDWPIKSNAELRRLMIRYGVVEHRISPYEALQRAIDDATLDYLAIRTLVDRESDSPSDLVHHPLYREMCTARETMVRYSTYAIQYDIAAKQQKLTETRVALLAHALQITLRQMGIPEQAIKDAPSKLIDNLQKADPKLDSMKATAITEIMNEDATVTIEG